MNTLRPRQNGSHFPRDFFHCIFLNENVWISIKISSNFAPKSPLYNIPALVQMMAWRRSGDKPLSGPMMVSLRTHICVTRPQWVNQTGRKSHFLYQKSNLLVASKLCTCHDRCPAVAFTLIHRDLIGENTFTTKKVTAPKLPVKMVNEASAWCHGIGMLCTFPLWEKSTFGQWIHSQGPVMWSFDAFVWCQPGQTVEQKVRFSVI